MKPAGYILLAILFINTILAANAQEPRYTALTIPDSLRQNANAVVRLDHKTIILSSQRQMTVKKNRVVTVLNKSGNNGVDAYVYYDKAIKIRSVEAVVYDAFGKEIKKIKRKNFKDRSAVSGVSLFEDDRVLFLDYTPVGYPYTVSE